MKVHFVSLGCPKNLVDSQVMLGKLSDGRHELTDDAESAEAIVINTCSFIEASKRESIDTIMELAEKKKSGACRSLVVTGCLAQRYHKQLEAEMPEVDAFLGTGEYHRITDVLDEVERSRGKPLPKRSWVSQPAFIHTERDTRVLTGPAHRAFLKISEGCNRRCAFCIIPKLRGNVRSRTVVSLIEEATTLASRGVRELNLVAQDLTHYGIETRYKESLEDLLPALAKIDGIDWIRLHYVYPDDFSDELVEIVAREPKIVKYLDMPIQHTADRVLKTMNRRLTREKLFSLVERLRARIPEIVFRTSIIVGFPGETEAEFEQLCADLKALNLDHVGVFEYSKEEDTRAAELDGQLPVAVKKRRSRRLIEILQEQANQGRQARLGKEDVVMIEGPSDESPHLIEARLATQAEGIDGRVLINDFDIENIQELAPGDFVRVEITEVMGPDFLARALAMKSLSRTRAQTVFVS